MSARDKATDGFEALTPRVLAPSTYGQGGRFGGLRGRPASNEGAFFAALERAAPPGDAALARDILAWAIEAGCDVWWLGDADGGCFVPVLTYGARQYQMFAVWTTGVIELYLLDGPDWRFYWYSHLPPFDGEPARLELLRRLNAIPSVAVPNRATARRPLVPLAALRPPGERRQFLAVLDWAVDAIWRAT